MPRGIPKDKSDKRRLLHELRIARGHLDKIIKMKESDAYCIDIVHQSLAVQSALRKINQKIMKHHMEHCVADAIRSGRDEKVIDEIVKVIKKI